MSVDVDVLGGSRCLLRLFAPIFAGNLASQRVAQKCGYTLEARMPHSAVKDGRVIDRVQYALYRPSEP